MLNFSFSQIADLNLSHFIPHPDFVYSYAGSTFVAGSIGGIYGLIGRVIYPKAGIIPLHYTIWFVAAYQIKLHLNLLENQFERFTERQGYLNQLKQISKYQFKWGDKIRYHCWRMIQLKNKTLQAIDRIVSQLLHIRLSHEVTVENIQNAFFLEMCRYRMWNVFKTTVINTFSSGIAYQLTKNIGFSLPQRTAVTFFIVMQSIVKDILLIPALHIYIRFCYQIADNLAEINPEIMVYQQDWIQRLLPKL